MAAPVINPLPDAPVRGEEYSLFTSKANAFVGALTPLATEINATATWTNDRAIEVLSNTQVAQTARDQSVAAKAASVSARDTAVTAKNTAITAKDTAVAARDIAVTKAAEASASALLIDPIIDPLPSRVPIRNTSGDIHARLFRSNFATQTSTPAGSTQFVMRNSTTDDYLRPVSRDAVMNYIGHALLHSDALRISGANIQLVKRNGSSEVINVGQVMKSLTAGAVGTTCLMRYVSNAAAGPGAILAGSLLRFAPTSGGGTVVGSGSWRVMGQFYTGSNVTVCMRIS